VRAVADAQPADQLFQIGQRRQHAGHAVLRGAPAARAVIAVNGAGDVAGLENFARAAVDLVADVEDHQVGGFDVGLQPRRIDQRRGRRRRHSKNHPRQKRTDQSPVHVHTLFTL